MDPARPPAMNAKPIKRITRAFHTMLVLSPENAKESPRKEALSMRLILKK